MRLCPHCHNPISDAVVDQLQAENDKLRDKCDTYSEIIEYMVHPDLYEQVKAENERLRELCADLYAEMITYSNAPNYNASVWAPKLRELGVEVDHGTR